MLADRYGYNLEKASIFLDGSRLHLPIQDFEGYPLDDEHRLQIKVKQRRYFEQKYFELYLLSRND